MTALRCRVEYRGELLSVAEAIKRSGCPHSVQTVRQRIFNLKWPVERALTEPPSYRGRIPRDPARREAEKKLVLELIESGVAQARIREMLGISKNVITGIAFRYRNAKEYKSGDLSAAPIPPPARTDMTNVAICWASGCDRPRPTASKFCSHHAFKPRVDQPMERLMAARA